MGLITFMFGWMPPIIRICAEFAVALFFVIGVLRIVSFIKNLIPFL